MGSHLTSIANITQAIQSIVPHLETQEIENLADLARWLELRAGDSQIINFGSEAQALRDKLTQWADVNEDEAMKQLIMGKQ